MFLLYTQRIQGSVLRLVAKALTDDDLPRHLQFPLQYSASRSQRQPQLASSVKPFAVIHMELEMVQPQEWGAKPLYSSSTESCEDALGCFAVAGSQPFANSTGKSIPTATYAPTFPSYHELVGQSSRFRLVAMVTTGILYCQGS